MSVMYVESALECAVTRDNSASAIGLPTRTDITIIIRPSVVEHASCQLSSHFNNSLYIATPQSLFTRPGHCMSSLSLWVNSTSGLRIRPLYMQISPSFVDKYPVYPPETVLFNGIQQKSNMATDAILNLLYCCKPTAKRH